MKKVIIFGGTTEGRRLAEYLAKAKVSVVYCVATEYGKQPVEESDFLRIHSGRMDAKEMTRLYETQIPDCVVDATHPFAELVKKEIENSLFEYKELPFFRLAREEEDNIDYSNSYFFDSLEECVGALKNTKGKIFLTTGSKELKTICQEEDLRERIVARVIPSEESIQICYENGLKGNQIIAMQGPFSAGLNLSLMKETEAKVVVLKESGKASGASSRIIAANKLGIKSFIIRRPVEKMDAMNYQQVKSALQGLFDIGDCIDDITPDKNINVVLAGFGMGFGSITEEVKEAIDKAHYIFGAPRMLVGIESKAKKYPYYLAKDIIPVLEKIENEIIAGTKNVVVLFSGDTGFYSGAAKLKIQLDKLKYCRTLIMPGISSIVALAAKLGETWHDSVIISTHGIEEEEWKSTLLEGVIHNKKLYAITSGSKDVRIIGEILTSLQQEGKGKFTVSIGANLYSDEKIVSLIPEKCANFNQEGLCTILIKNENATEKYLAPNLNDDDFIRDKVPMSKEEIRALSICKLKLTTNSIVYDIGSGSGSVAVEMARLHPSVKVFAIEIKDEACLLIQKNIAKFKLSNVKVIEGAAPEALAGLLLPTHVFIGGSGGRLESIIATLKSYDTHMRIVINSVTLETISEINRVLRKYEIDNADIVQVTVAKAKKAGDFSIMQGQNPVYIVTFDI